MLDWNLASFRDGQAGSYVSMIKAKIRTKDSCSRGERVAAGA